MRHFGQLETTIRPARHRFADIALIYVTHTPKEQVGNSLPIFLDDFDRFERIMEWASYEIRTGLWEIV